MDSDLNSNKRKAENSPISNKSTPLKRIGLSRYNNKFRVLSSSNETTSETTFGLTTPSPKTKKKFVSPFKTHVCSPLVTKIENLTDQKLKIKSNSNDLEKLTNEQLLDEINSTKERIQLKQEQLLRFETEDVDHDVLEKQKKLEEINGLKKLWLKGCQEALEDLLIVLKENNSSLTMNTLLKELRLPFELVDFNDEEESFND